MGLVLFRVLCTILSALWTMCSGELPLCTDPSVQQLPCANNDSYCGDWDIVTRTYTPNNCRYREVSSEGALKCLRNRTIACVGDSIVRDMCIGLALYLSGETVLDGPDYKYDRKAELHTHYTNASKIGIFKSWKLNRLNYNGLLFPKTDRNHSDWTWQIQVWELHSTEYQGDHRVEDVLENKMAHQVPELSLRNIDLAFWSHGLHDQPAWIMPPYGQRYFDSIVRQWLKVREKVPTPVVWTSINPHCLQQDPLAKRAATSHTVSPFVRQVKMVTEANLYTRAKLREMKLPYYDSAAPLRSPQICSLSSDGVHVKMWVDLVRAQILLNHLCDEDNNWVGDVGRF